MSTRTPARSSARLPLIITAVFVVVIALVAVALLLTRLQGSDPGVPLVADDTQLLTPGGSEVVLVEFADFQCPACAAFHPYVEEVREEFGDRVTVAFRHFPLAQHPHAVEAAIAAEAAGRQGRFLEMYDALFSTQEQWTGMPEVTAGYRGLAEQLGLDLERFDADIADPVLREQVLADAAAGEAHGVRSTPTFFLNGEPLTLERFTDLRVAVEAALG